MQAADNATRNISDRDAAARVSALRAEVERLSSMGLDWDDDGDLDVDICKSAGPVVHVDPEVRKPRNAIPQKRGKKPFVDFVMPRPQNGEDCHSFARRITSKMKWTLKPKRRVNPDEYEA